jgi:hypothetical protein
MTVQQRRTRRPSWRRLLPAVVAVLVVGATRADAARTVYASPTARFGDFDADGSRERPYSLAYATSTLSSGDTLYLLPGEYRTPGLTISDVDDVLIATDPGSDERAVIRGDLPLPGWTWQRVSQTVWSVPVPERPVGVVWNWDSNLTSLTAEDIELGRVPRNFGHLRETDSLDTLEASPGSWFWADNVLRIHPPPGAAAPDAGGVYARLRPGVALRPTNCARLTIRDIDFALWTEVTNNAGYSVKFTNCVDSVVESSLSRDSGWHAYGAVGFPNGGITIRNCESRGQRTDGERVSNPFVFANTVRNKGSVSGFIGEDLTHHAYGLLDWQGLPLTPGYSGVSLLSHGTVGSTIHDVAWRRAFVMTYDDEPLCMLANAWDSAESALPSSASAYDARVLDSRIRSAAPGVRGSVSVSRTAFDIRPGRTWQSDGSAPLGVSGTTVLYSACTFVFDLSHAPFGRLFDVRDGGRLLLAHSSLYSITLAEDGGSGRTDAERGAFALVADGDSSLIALNSVFARDQAGSFFVDETPDGTGVETRDCWYVHLPFGPDEAPDSATGIDAKSVPIGDQAALADPGGVYNDYPGMIAPERGDFSAPATAPIRTLRQPATRPAIRMGINGEPYSGHFGALQYGWSVCPADRSGDLIVNSADLGILLSRWQSDDRTADVNADGVVDGADLGIVLSNWGACPTR